MLSAKRRDTTRRTAGKTQPVSPLPEVIAHIDILPGLKDGDCCGGHAFFA
ncbi:hypothetical protein JWG39_02205 [Desulforhopalus vacuolatus]|nr:hypothetical protein [Desulforhopalus vacuolatus]MBM9518629.1 hypothetical protein [Desulforhopalus vacuolatus]